ncbi:MAG: hypothetical protein Q9215_006679 [Flavoplaca cf. flavocitrina]
MCLESLQSWIAKNASIDLQDQILMTARGKQVKLQTLSLENEIFVYSRQILSASGQTSLTSSLPTTLCPDHYKPKPAPATPSNKDSVESWQQLFNDRSAWAEDLHHRCTKIREYIHQLGQEASVIQRSAAIAVDNVKQHIANLRPKYEDSTLWADNVSHDQSYLLEQWEGLVGKYPSIPTIRALGRCLAGSPAILHESSMSSSSKSETSLYDFVTISELTRASNAGKGSSQRFRSRANDLRVAYTDVEQKANSIVDSFGRDEQFPDSTSTRQADHVLEEIAVVTNKIKADRDFVLGLTGAINPVPHVTRIALLHTRSFIPTLLQTTEELHQLLQRNVEHKNDAQIAGVQYLQDISAVESRIALVHNKLAKLDLDQDDQHVFEILGAGTRLPFIYGLLLVECVQRLEWTEKITADSSSLVEEVATFKEEENQRRKKWIRDMGDVVNLTSLDEMSLGFDINVRIEKHHWPQLTRDDIHSYIKTLRELGGFEDAIKEVQAAFVTLDSPTKQQLRRAKAFKNGSIHDTTFGQKSLLLRADDDILQTLKGEKIRMEDKLKSSESRIRKLEDLLHRQSQASRPSSSGNPFGIQAPPIERYNTSPVIGFTTSMAKPPEPASRRSSTSSRRISTYIDSEDKGLGKRIANLEAELSAEKIQSANLQKDAAARLDVEDNLKAQVREAVSTKEDLLGNLEAQQKEFDDERYLLEDENRKLKIRLEEAEDELDRVLGSRDHEARAHALEEELQRIREEANLDVRSSRAQNEALRTEHEALHEANSKLQDQHTKLNARFENVSVRLRDRETVDSEHCAALRSALLQNDPDMVIQNDLRASAKAAEAAIRKQMLNMEELKELVKKAQTENVALESRLSNQNIEMQDLRDRLGNEEMEVFNTRESLAEYRQDLERTRTDLKQERSDHDELKAKQQATDITVESLQARLTRLDSEILAFQNAQEDFKSRERDLRNTHNLSSDRLRQRGSRADDVCKRMYMHISCLQNILEQVGYAVTRQQGVPMTVQKMPKAPSTLGSSGPLPTEAVTETSPSPGYLSWAMCDDPEMEGQWYDRLNEDLQTFDMNVFHEAIVKRIKDAEHLARKWQREARGCREKAHRAQSEANEKIAYRSFKEGDLALFLPTRNQATRPWAAFNVGAPHYFLKEQDSHKLRSRDWLLARISRIEERMVDLSRSINAVNGDRQSVGDASDGASLEDENPFELSDGLRWYLLDAAEEKPGAPINIGLGKATVASASVDAKGSSIRNEQATKSLLTRSLDSRRSSTNSKKGQPVAAAAVQPDSNANDVDAAGAGAVPKLADHMPERVDRVAGDQSRTEHSNDAEERIAENITMPKEKATRKSKAKAETGGKRKKDPNAPKRGLSAYMFFANDNRENVREENAGISFGQVGKVLGERWKALNQKQREPYEAKAKADKERYEKEKAAYNDQPADEDEDEE